MGTKSLAVTLFCFHYYCMGRGVYRLAISCALRGDGARLLVVVFVRNVTYTRNLK